MGQRCRCCPTMPPLPKEHKLRAGQWVLCLPGYLHQGLHREMLFRSESQGGGTWTQARPLTRRAEQDSALNTCLGERRGCSASPGSGSPPWPLSSDPLVRQVVRGSGYPWSRPGIAGHVGGGQPRPHCTPAHSGHPPLCFGCSLGSSLPSCPLQLCGPPHPWHQLSSHRLLLPGPPRVLAPPRGRWAHHVFTGQMAARNPERRHGWGLQDSPPGPRTVQGQGVASYSLQQLRSGSPSGQLHTVLQGSQPSAEGLC